MKCNLRVTWIMYRGSPYPLRQKTENRFNLYIKEEKIYIKIYYVIYVYIMREKNDLFYIVRLY